MYFDLQSNEEGTRAGVSTLFSWVPVGSLQAIRGNYRYTGTQGSCTTGTYDDADDLVFAVSDGSGGGCTLDSECDDGAWCNGAETCNAGTCSAGTAPNCDDGVACTDDVCDEGSDSCGSTANDANCDNGAWCDGSDCTRSVTKLRAPTSESAGGVGL